MFVRPVKESDIDDLMQLSHIGVKGMTTLPKSSDDWYKRIKKSIDSFAQLPNPTEEDGCYMMVLEKDGVAIGTTAIYTQIGINRPFYNYRISNYTHISPELNIRITGTMLHLVNDYDGVCEVGTLLLQPMKRGKGAGRLAANARYLLIAAFLDAFPKTIMAELRGYRNPVTDVSPFWEAVGKHFFNLSFDLADEFSAKDYRFIADLMPKVPIYTKLLPQDAQNSIGKVHNDAIPAEKMLYERGFRYRGLIDIFDGGPCMDAYLHHIDMIDNSKKVKLKIGTALKPAYGLVGNLLGASPKDIKIFQGTTDGHSLYISEEQLQSQLKSLAIYEGLEVLMSYEKN
jgi:arginine N-succinyltransferase